MSQDSAVAPEMVSCTVDGITITVPKGTRILDAAARAGIDVPHYCYHPGLSSPAQCRMCLVEVEKVPKLVPSCTAQVAEGNVIHTQSDTALRAREGVLEFYLVNHPLDCPVCDASGACKLQDYVSLEGPDHGRLREPKRVLGRDDFGGDVLFNADRCVMCTRCVRFMREVAQDERLTVVERGHRMVIDTFFDEGVEGNVWADNIIDLCPVGALVSKDFLHKARAWDLDRVPSICPNCSMGCNVTLQVRDNQVQRLKPRPNDEVNGHWMCDFGRLNYGWINRGTAQVGGPPTELPGAPGDTRIEVPLVRADGRHSPTSWAEALTALADALRDGGNEGVEAVVSPFASNEDMGALVRLMERLGGGCGTFRAERGEQVELPGFPQLKLRRDRAANVAAAERFGFGRRGDDAGRGGLEAASGHRGVLLVLGDELRDAPPEFGRDAALFVYVGHFLAPAARNAHFVLPATSFAEMDGTFLNADGRVQRFWPALRAPGMARPAWQILGVLLAGIAEVAAPATAEDAFDSLGEVRAEFGGLRFADLGAQGRLLPELDAVAGAAS